MSDTPPPPAQFFDWLLHVSGNSLLDIGAVLWSATLAIYGASFGVLHRRVRELEQKCHGCPAKMVTDRNAAIIAAEERWHARLQDAELRFLGRLDQQDSRMQSGFERLEHLIVGVQAKAGEQRHVA